MHTQHTSTGDVNYGGNIDPAAAYAAASGGDEIHLDDLPAVDAPITVTPKSWPHAVYGESGLTLALKHINEGNNPREYFDEKAMEELTETVKIYGVFTAILLRYVDGRYVIVAGHRRYRAAMSAHGDEYLIPVRIQVMSDEEAHILATIENTVRDDMSAIEDARSAAKVLGRVKGDRKEAARILGWKLARFESRLALMNCSDLVQQAVIERRLKLGHAELLATLSKEKQDILAPVVISEKKSVEEVKAAIAHASCKLSDAIFKKDDCAKCQHNSSLQAAMFAESITDGCCTHAQCFTRKTEEELQVRADALKDEYPVIRIVRIGENLTRTKLVADGPKGVGAEQAEACKACSSYGAAVSGLPQAMGAVYTEQCFDTACNANKVAARIQAEEKAKQAQSTAAKVEQQSDGAKGKEVDVSKADKADRANKSVSVEPSSKMKEYRVKLWRRAMTSEISSNPEKSLQYLLALSLNGSARHINSTLLSNALGKLTGDNTSRKGSGFESQLRAVETLSAEASSSLTTLLAASAMDQLDVHYLQQLAKHHKLDLTLHWKLDEEFLQMLSKSEIEVLCKELRLDREFGDAFKGFFTKLKPDLIKSLLSSKSFDYSAKIPKVLAY